MYRKIFFSRQIVRQLAGPALVSGHRGSLPAKGPGGRIRRVRANATTTSADSELVGSIRQGDSPAEGALYEKYSSRIYFLALSELHSSEDAEDVRAETFLRVLQALRQDQLRSPDSLGSFIVGVALNVIREQVRHKYKMQPLDEIHLEVSGERSLETAFIDSEAREAIREVARRLKPREQAFVRMHYYEGMANEEVARSLGVKPERLRLIKSRALKSFRKIYKKLSKS